MGLGGITELTYYTGKKVLISGGSQGLGRATAIELARAGAHVCIAARGRDALDETFAAMRSAAEGRQSTLLARELDVTDPEAVDRVVAEVVARMGGIDLLICNQGYASTGRVHKLAQYAFRRLIDVNYLGHANLCRAVSPHLIEQRSGQVVLISSALGYMSIYGYAAYSASKWAIAGFAHGLRDELALFGVGVKLVYPSTMQTPGLDQENADKPKVLWEIESNNALNTIRSPEDVARRLLRLIPKSRFEHPIGWDGWLTYLIARHAPWLMRRINAKDLRNAIRKHGEVALDAPQQSAVL